MEDYYKVRDAKEAFLQLLEDYGDGTITEDMVSEILRETQRYSFVFRCDQQSCEKCKEPCKHTANAEHAVNFKRYTLPDGYNHSIIVYQEEK